MVEAQVVEKVKKEEKVEVVEKVKEKATKEGMVLEVQKTKRILRNRKQ